MLLSRIAYQSTLATISQIYCGLLEWFLRTYIMIASLVDYVKGQLSLAPVVHLRETDSFSHLTIVITIVSSMLF